MELPRCLIKHEQSDEPKREEGDQKIQRQGANLHPLQKPESPTKVSSLE